MSEKELNKKAQANIIAVVLIILIVIVAVMVIWNVVRPLVEEKGEGIETGSLLMNLDVEEVFLFETQSSIISVRRGAGRGELNSLTFVFYDDGGQTKTEKIEENLPDELETKTYYFSPVFGLGKIEKVSVVPVVGGNLGMESELKTKETLEIPSGLVSWWRFDGDTDDFMGGNNCELITGELNCGNNLSLSINNDMAISFWIKTTADSGSIIRKGSNYEIGLEDKQVKFSFNGQSQETISEIDTGWNHIVVSADTGGTSSIYINTLPGKSFSGVSFIFDSNADFIIDSLNGEVDELMFFNKSLALPQIEGLYNNQKQYFP